MYSLLVLISSFVAGYIWVTEGHTLMLITIGFMIASINVYNRYKLEKVFREFIKFNQKIF